MTKEQAFNAVVLRAFISSRGQPGDAYLMEVARRLEADFGIQHTTLQIETDPGLKCALAPEHVV